MTTVTICPECNLPADTGIVDDAHDCDAASFERFDTPHECDECEDDEEAAEDLHAES